MTPFSRRGVIAAVGAALALTISACGGAAYAPTPTTSAAPSTTSAAPTTTGAPAPAPVACNNATQSYAALPSLPSAASVGGRLTEVARRAAEHGRVDDNQRRGVLNIGQKRQSERAAVLQGDLGVQFEPPRAQRIDHMRADAIVAQQPIAETEHEHFSVG